MRISFSISFSLIAKAYTTMPGVRISVDPQEALIDEEVDIRVMGLPPNGRITIKASVKEGDILMSSYGCYTATAQGIVSVRDQASLEGTYTGQ